MKKNRLLIAVLSLITCSSFAQLTSHVDERFELTSIVFRLADAEEYVNNEVIGYANDIDAYFAAYKEHPLIQFIKEIREHDGIAYNAVSGFTTLLKINNNNIQLNSQENFDKYLTYDPRWTKKTFLRFVELLNVFYKDTKFNIFYNQHLNLYAEAEKRFNTLLNSIDISWFESFFGETFGTPFIYVSLSNGRSNYSLLSDKKDGTLGYGIIIGCSTVDQEGIPLFNSQISSVIIHEFSHHFTHIVISQYEKEMIEAAEKIFPHVEKQLNAVAYGTASATLDEGLNNLFVNMYFKEHSTGFEKYNIAKDERYGFIWMRRAVKFMDNFYENRKIYPFIKDFMPQIVSFMNTTGNYIEQVVNEYKQSNPYVTNIFPGLNTVVSSEINEIRINFSHPMWNSSGIAKSIQADLDLPNIELGHWTEDKRTFIVPVKLEKGKNYGLSLPNYAFLSEDTFFMKENFEITFKTAE
ncbi:MAG: DUF4932 domain-containing protein [Candidatus Symbiothrix sp.]|jgi:hypothetical protein|nr:DUF4932 domain-containing protein [Candidatus Symbiothrix sp.]